MTKHNDYAKYYVQKWTSKYNFEIMTSNLFNLL